MALREDQVQRYGRQILLKELGGRGQRALLEAPVAVLADGPGIAEAVAYLAAGGSPLRLPPSLRLDGFLGGAAPTALSPDAAGEGPARVTLAPRSVPSDAAPLVVLGGGVAWRTGAGCAACWAEVLRALPAEGPPTALGSLAALAVQRLVLGWAEPEGLIAWRDDRLSRPPLPRCPDHGISQ